MDLQGSVSLAIMFGLCVFCIAVNWGIARRASRNVRTLETQVSKLESDLQTALSGSMGIGHRLLALEKRLQQVSGDRSEVVSSSDEFAYGQAMQMLQQGADVASVASNCGFSASEAELMALIQRQIHQKQQAEPSQENKQFRVTSSSELLPENT